MLHSLEGRRKWYFLSGCGVCVLLQWSWLLQGVWMMEQSQDPAADEGGGFRSPGHSWSRHSSALQRTAESVHRAAAWQWLLSLEIGLACLQTLLGSSSGTPRSPSWCSERQLECLLSSADKGDPHRDVCGGGFCSWTCCPCAEGGACAAPCFLVVISLRGVFSFLSTPTLLWLRLLQCCRNDKGAGTPSLSAQPERAEPGQGGRP